MFSGLKHQVMQVLQNGGLVDELGKDAFFVDKQTALETLEKYYARGVVNFPVRDGRSPWRDGRAAGQLL